MQSPEKSTEMGQEKQSPPKKFTNASYEEHDEREGAKAVQQSKSSAASNKPKQKAKRVEVEKEKQHSTNGDEVLASGSQKQ